MFMQHDQLEHYMTKYLVYSIIWAFSGDSKLKIRQDLGDFVRNVTTIPLPMNQNVPIIDFEVCIHNDLIYDQTDVIY